MMNRNWQGDRDDMRDERSSNRRNFMSSDRGPDRWNDRDHNWDSRGNQKGGMQDRSMGNTMGRMGGAMGSSWNEQSRGMYGSRNSGGMSRGGMNQGRQGSRFESDYRDTDYDNDDRAMQGRGNYSLDFNENSERYRGYGAAGYEQDYGRGDYGYGYAPNENSNQGYQSIQNNQTYGTRGNGFGNSGSANMTGGNRYGVMGSDQRSMGRSSSDSGYSYQGLGDEGYAGDTYGPEYGQFGRGQERGMSNSSRQTGGNWGGSMANDMNSQSGRAMSQFGQSSSGGQHRGKGPKNYSRSDDRIREDVCECLMQEGDVDATEIEVQVKDGIVTLIGIVNSKQEKRRAEDAIERLSGVKDVTNELRVEQSGTGSQGNGAMNRTADGSGTSELGSQSSGSTGRSRSTRVS